MDAINVPAPACVMIASQRGNNCSCEMYAATRTFWGSAPSVIGDLGADAFLSKPFDLDVLNAMVHSLVA
jgi:hypothetical protein